MICSVCNKEVENGIKICPFCGAFLDEKEENVIEVSFKKPAPPPVIELSFVEPEPEAEIELEIAYNYSEDLEDKFFFTSLVTKHPGYSKSDETLENEVISALNSYNNDVDTYELFEILPLENSKFQLNFGLPL